MDGNEQKEQVSVEDHIDPHKTAYEELKEWAHSLVEKLKAHGITHHVPGDAPEVVEEKE